MTVCIAVWPEFTGTYVYEIELRKRVDVDILIPYGMNRDEFVAKGREAIGDVRFNFVMDQIAATDLGIELLVLGLDGYAQSQMFTVSAKGAIIHSVLRYEAIGNGAPTALGSFYQLRYFPTPDLEDVLYRTCAAKFAAENVPGVGRETYALVVEPMSGAWTLVMEVERLRRIWESKGQPPFPSEARRLVSRDLRRLRKTQEHILKSGVKRRRTRDGAT